MNLQENIRRILREEYIPTETEYLGWDIPRKLYDELEDIGIKRWDKENDKVYIAEFQFDTKSVVFEILDSTGEAYFNSLFPIPLSYKSYHTKKIKDLPISIKYFIRRRFEQEWVNIMDKYDDDGKIIQENIRRVLKEEMELNPTERVYDYDPGRDTVPERLPFDIDKLVNSGVVFVTPAINGNPKSKNYKKWMKTPHTHLISLYNVENSSEDGWILKAITKRASTGQLKGNFVDKIYDGKYNQILWSLEKLGINPMDMLIDMNLQESIRRVLREETNVPLSFRRRITNSDTEEEFLKALDSIDYSRLHNQFSPIKNISLKTFAKLVIDEMYMYLEKDYFSDEDSILFDNDEIYHEKIRVPLINYFGDRIKKRYNGNKINESVDKTYDNNRNSD